VDPKGLLGLGAEVAIGTCGSGWAYFHIDGKWPCTPGVRTELALWIKSARFVNRRQRAPAQERLN